MLTPNKVGRPCKRESVKELKDKIDQYILYCTDEDNKEIPDVEGLCYFLGTNRETLNSYSKKENFSDTIKGVKERIAYNKKQLAMGGKINPTVFVFDFKNNHGYKDKQEIDQNTNLVVSDVNISIDE